MNIAFQALLLFILLLPGLILRSTYNGRISKELVLPENYPPFSREAVRIFLYAVVLQASWVALSNAVYAPWGIGVDLYSIVYMLMGNYSEASLEQRVIHAVVREPLLPLIYFLSLYVVSAVIGFQSHRMIRSRGLDKKYNFFRFNNEWHYLLTGEVREFPDVFDDPREVDFVIVSAVVDVAGRAVLYIGVVVDYSLDGKGNLKHLRLKRAFRRDLEKDRDSNHGERTSVGDDSRYYKIEGDFFVLDCANARNLNIEYGFLKLKEAKDETVNEDVKA